jgi:pimeloyl-ACP methyl ester carboxylesterase
MMSLLCCTDPMPAVFVHGNPETTAIWGELFDALQRDDLVALSPPGFGAAVPEGWTATRSEYVAWLATELDAIEGPIDLVGHDWGGGHVLGFLLENPEAVRSWCVDLIGILHPDYVWHDAALVWQTPNDGEANIAGMIATPTADLAAFYETLGMSSAAAVDAASAVNKDMGACVLGLYRDAAQPALAELGKSTEALMVRPGLMVNAENDHYVGTDEMAQVAADRAGAQVVHLVDVGHWWMCEDPALGAATLESFWASV